MSISLEQPTKKRRAKLALSLLGLGVFIVIGIWLWPFILEAREAARRASCIGQMKFFSLDMHNYHDVNHHFPPAYLTDKEGRPAHSWRVILLQVGEGTLYERYNFDEPWNGPHNRALAGGLPIGMSGVYPWYHCASDGDSDKLHRSYVMVVGANTFSAGSTTTKFKDFTDGSANTIALAEMSKSGIHWMEPRDLNFDEMSFRINDPNGQGLRSEHPGVVNVMFADGMVRSVRNDIDPEVLKSHFMISGRKNHTPLDDY